MKAHIPNIITLLNLLCGSIAVIYAVNNNITFAAAFVFLGIFFDFFDGFLARKLNVSGPLGVQLDSLADMVTSGLVPGIIMLKLLERVVGDNMWVPFLGLGITLASAYRLAKFNIDTEQQNFFKGLPTPANTILILSLPLILKYQPTTFLQNIILNPWFLVLFTLLSCYLLNSNIKLFALKFTSFKFKPNTTRYIFLILSIILIVCLKFISIPLIIFLYFILSILNNKNSK